MTPSRLARLVILLAAAFATGAAAEHPAAGVVLRFGEALAAKRAGDLRPLLPREGRVRVELEHFGAHLGLFSPAQVEALFRTFLRQGEVRRFSVARVEPRSERHVRVHALCSVSEAGTRQAHVSLELGLEIEDERWVIRAIRETSR